MPKKSKVENETFEKVHSEMEVLSKKIRKALSNDTDESTVALLIEERNRLQDIMMYQHNIHPEIVDKIFFSCVLGDFY